LFLWGSDALFVSQGASLTKEVAKMLIDKGRVFMKGLKSPKTGNKYDAWIIIDDSEQKIVRFKMEFGKSDKFDSCS